MYFFSTFALQSFSTGLQIAYRLQNWRNAFATVALNAVKAHIEESNLTEDEITEAVEIFLTPDGNPPTTPYFWQDWDIADDGSAKKSVWLNLLSTQSYSAKMSAFFCRDIARMDLSSTLSEWLIWSSMKTFLVQTSSMKMRSP